MATPPTGTCLECGKTAGEPVCADGNCGTSLTPFAGQLCMPSSTGALGEACLPGNTCASNYPGLTCDATTKLCLCGPKELANKLCADGKVCGGSAANTTLPFYLKDMTFDGPTGTLSTKSTDSIEACVQQCGVDVPTGLARAAFIPKTATDATKCYCYTTADPVKAVCTRSMTGGWEQRYSSDFVVPPQLCAAL